MKRGMSKKEVRKYLGNDKDMEKFMEWIGGQTCPVLKNGEGGFYKWDVERFKYNVLRGRPTYFD